MEKKRKLNFDSDIYNTIRKNIKKYRKLKGITAMELSEMVDLSHDFIRQIESEKVAYNPEITITLNINKTNIAFLRPIRSVNLCK